MARHIVGLGILLSCIAWASNGSNGSSGADGRNGNPGSPLVATADGTPQVHYIRGFAGQNGAPGGDGGDAYCADQEDYGNGGDGGSGGDGGNGGNGGSITLYFTDINAVQKIQVDDKGGPAGIGGRGGDGGYPCGNGFPGSGGHSGAAGHAGNYGVIRLIPQLTPLSSENPSAVLKMVDMEKAPVDLSVNNWDKRKSARTLFAPGSLVSDDYLYFINRVEARCTFQWKAKIPLSDFKKDKFSVTLTGTELKFNLPNSIWFEKEETAGLAKDISFTAAVYKRDAFQLYLQKGIGTGNDLRFSFKDKAEVSDIVKTSVDLEYSTYEKGWKKRFTGPVPAEAISIQATSVDILVGKLPIDPQYLISGTQTRLQFKVTRSLGEFATSKQFSVNHTIK